jgi:hypothetical protein
MATRFLVVNDVTGRARLTSLGSSLFIVENFDVVIAGTTFTLATAFSVGSIIEVWKNGQLVREGALYDYTRDADNSQIIFNSAVSAGAWVSIKIWS